MPESLSTNYVGDTSKIAERKDRSHVSVAEVDTVTRKSAKSAKGLANDANVSTGINQLTCPYNNKMQRKGRKLLTKKVSCPCCQISCFYLQYKGPCIVEPENTFTYFICCFLGTEIKD